MWVQRKPILCHLGEEGLPGLKDIAAVAVAGTEASARGLHHGLGKKPADANEGATALQAGRVDWAFEPGVVRPLVERPICPLTFVAERRLGLVFAPFERGGTHDRLPKHLNQLPSVQGLVWSAREL
jgi:hypothetical protein